MVVSFRIIRPSSIWSLPSLRFGETSVQRHQEICFYNQLKVNFYPLTHSPLKKLHFQPILEPDFPKMLNIHLTETWNWWWHNNSKTNKRSLLFNRFLDNAGKKNSILLLCSLKIFFHNILHYCNFNSIKQDLKHRF